MATRGREAFKPEFIETARYAAERGATDREVAELLDVTERTVNAWKLKYPEFGEALKVGKDAADERVLNSLYRKATGYSFDSEKISIDKDGRVIRVPCVEHVPPSDTAMIFWLKNRRRGEWADRQRHEHTFDDMPDEQLEAEIDRLAGKLRPKPE